MSNCVVCGYIRSVIDDTELLLQLASLCRIILSWITARKYAHSGGAMGA
ncbi:hypothetical protein QP555_02815 [Peptoniphilus lacrimalis]|nr:hypothetical protein [Peptoniphilus lacrimalis]MDK7721949.1 hypothetical protein [Peptoniphilus lacrimalis]MDK7731551.1 hypothetical protein [Peptoniphilus lacrimalis]